MTYRRWEATEAWKALTLRQDGLTYAEIAHELNLIWDNARTEDKVSDAFRKGMLERVVQGDPLSFDDRVGRKFKSIQAEDGSTTIDGNKPYSDEEMAEMFGIDMDDWFVTKRITNQWGKNFQTKLFWAPNELNIVSNNWDEFLEEIRNVAPEVGHLPSSSSGLMYELLIYDAHIGAKAWGPETGEDYDLYIALERYETAFMYLLDHCPVEAERLLVVVGQDLFHFDTLIQGKGGATAKGTPQDVDSRWQKLFIAVCDMMARLLAHAAVLFPLDIIVQPGNHDKQTTFYLGRFLEAVFAGNANVRIDNSPKPRKYKRWGQALIGYAHGNNEKAKDLYGLMTEEEGTALWREWHLGHVHQEECSEDGTMRIRTIPALTGKESWHNEQGYRGIPGGRAFLWDRDSGIVRQEYYNVPIAETSTDNLGEILRD